MGIDATPSAGSGGIVFRAAGELWFLPATAAVKLMPTPEIARVPGAPADIVGVALVDGETVPVVGVGEVATRERTEREGVREGDRRMRPMLVVAHLGERVALVGLEVLATGCFEPGEAAGERDKIKYGDHVASAFDVGALVARIREGRWQV